MTSLVVFNWKRQQGSSCWVSGWTTHDGRAGTATVSIVRARATLTLRFDGQAPFHTSEHDFMHQAIARAYIELAREIDRRVTS